MGHGPAIYPDETLVIQLLLFFITYFILRFFVFKPYLAIFQMREEKTQGLRAKAKKSREQAERLKTDYEVFIQEQRNKDAVWAEEQRRAIAQAEKSLLDQTKKEVALELKKVKEDIGKAIDRAKEELADRVPELSSQIASQMLGYHVDVGKKNLKQHERKKHDQRVLG